MTFCRSFFSRRYAPSCIPGSVAYHVDLSFEKLVPSGDQFFCDILPSLFPFVCHSKKPPASPVTHRRAGIVLKPDSVATLFVELLQMVLKNLRSIYVHGTYKVRFISLHFRNSNARLADYAKKFLPSRRLLFVSSSNSETGGGFYESEGRGVEPVPAVKREMAHRSRIFAVGTCFFGAQPHVPPARGPSGGRPRRARESPFRRMPEPILADEQSSAQTVKKVHLKFIDPGGRVP